MPAQRVLEHPVPALVLLAGQQVGVAKLAGALAQVAAHGQQVEADLSGVVAGDAPPEHLDDARGEGVGVAGAVGDGRGLQAVELEQHAVDGQVGDEVERVVRLAGLVRLVDERAAPREAVVHLADQIRVAQRLAAELGRQHHGEFAEIGQRLAHVDVCGAVEQHAEEGLGGARVLDRLRGEEDGLGGVTVELAVEGPVGSGVGLVRRVLEEEDDAVNGLQREEVLRIERHELFELHALDPEVLDERGEDTLEGVRIL